jgi:hypothetical protein
MDCYKSCRKKRVFAVIAAVAVCAAGIWLLVETGFSLETGLASCGNVSQRIWLDIGEYQNGYAPAMDRKSGKWGYVNEEEKLVIACRFTDAGYFNEEGRAIVRDETNAYCIDTAGQIIFSCDTYEKTFCDGVLPVFEDTVDDRDEMVRTFYFLDENGERAFANGFRYARGFSDGMAVVSNSKGAGSCWAEDGEMILYGYVDTTGELVLPCRYTFASDFDEDGYATVGIYDEETQSTRTVIIDKNGNEIVA